MLEHQQGVAPGDFLTTAEGTVITGRTSNQGGPLILDSYARPIWFSPVPGQGDDLQQETYEGKPVLVWFETGSVQPVATNPGQVVVVNDHYRPIARLRPHSPWNADLHDAWIIGGDIWITVDRLVRGQNLAPYGGPSSASVLDVGLQEYQVSNGQLIRTWDALNPGGQPNIPLSASEAVPVTDGWDPYHLNSVQALPNGDLLVSMRNTSAVYLIDPAQNKILWTLGGKDSTFSLGSGAAFAWQHDARLVDPGQEGQGRAVKLTLFNNNDDGSTSTGMILSLDTIAGQATLVSAYSHYPPLSSNGLGSMQLLANGNALVGWGHEPFFSEYSQSGRELLDVRWPGAMYSYRALLTDTWIGTPYYPPSGAVRGSNVYASWNGATEVAKWEVLAGRSSSNLTVVATHRRASFETAIKLSRTYGVYEVRALTGRGRVLGTSKPFS